MRPLFLLLAAVILTACAAANAEDRPRLTTVAPADSVEYVLHWPAATSDVGTITKYRVVIHQGPGTFTHDSVTGLADSVNVLKPACGTTVYPFSATVTPYVNASAGTALVVSWTYVRPCPTIGFPVGAAVTVDSSKIVRP